MSVVAGVTVFSPDTGELMELVRRLSSDGVPILMHIDGDEALDGNPGLGHILDAHPNITVLRSRINSGIGAGLNRLAEAASAAGFTHILYFDQDSAPPPGMAERLGAASARLIAGGFSPAALGALPKGRGDEAQKAPRYHKRPQAGLPAGIFRTRFVITSGSLIALGAIAAAGPFRADYFIDAIDTEWCFRARSMGFGIFFDETVTMTHRIGHGVIRLGPVTMPRQPEWRMAHYFRNQAHGLTLRHVPLGWKLRQTLYMPLQVAVFLARGDATRGSLRRLLRAVVSGLRGRLG